MLRSALLTSVLAASTVAAQPVPSPDRPAEPARIVSISPTSADVAFQNGVTASDPASRVSAGGAVALSLGGTLAPLLLAAAIGDDDVSGALVLSGLLLGPSLGNLAQGEYGNATTGALIRLGGTSVMLFATNAPLTGSDQNADVLMIAGGLTALAGGLYDVVTAERAGRRVRVAPVADVRTGTVGARVRVGL